MKDEEFTKEKTLIDEAKKDIKEKRPVFASVEDI